MSTLEAIPTRLLDGEEGEVAETTSPSN
jgi:hypothetical protein